MENCWAASAKAEHMCTLLCQQLHSHVCPTDVQMCIHQKTGTRMLSVALIIKAKNCKLFKCASTSEWKNTAVILSGHENEQPATTRNDTENVKQKKSDTRAHTA